MGEFEEKLNSILSSPKDMEKIMSLAQSISSSLGSGSSDDSAVSDNESDFASTPDSGLDPDMLKIAAKVMSAYSSDRQNEKSVLLDAIRPYLKPQRRETVDKALNVLKLTKIARIALSEFGGDGHV